MNSPLVSIICLSYNHAHTIKETLESVFMQTYVPVELIVVDDHSEDQSREIIELLTRERPKIKKVFLNRNVGNCKAFNIGFGMSAGEFIIDLAADDVLMKDRVRTGVDCLTRSGKEYGVHFSDAEYIDVNSRHIRYHYKRDSRGRLLEMIPQGDIYHEVLSRYFICTPTMMMRRNVLEDLEGYDENLAYEDFDFWVRSSRKYKYCYSDQVLVKKRILGNSLSSRQYIKGSSLLASTYAVCLKAERLNKRAQDHRGLMKRAAFECRQALRSGNYKMALKFAALIDRTPLT
jgi:glycosyltransferase involved in cell wall biosynthesis